MKGLCLEHQEVGHQESCLSHMGQEFGHRRAVHHSQDCRRGAGAPSLSRRPLPPRWGLRGRRGEERSFPNAPAACRPRAVPRVSLCQPPHRPAQTPPASETDNWGPMEEVRILFCSDNNPSRAKTKQTNQKATKTKTKQKAHSDFSYKSFTTPPMKVGTKLVMFSFT